MKDLEGNTKQKGMEQNENKSDSANNAAKTGKDHLKTFYFWEKDRLESFKHWPFDDKHPCNIAKVNKIIFISFSSNSNVIHSNNLHRWLKRDSIGAEMNVKLIVLPVSCAINTWTDGKWMTIHGKSISNTHHNVILQRHANQRGILRYETVKSKYSKR